MSSYPFTALPASTMAGMPYAAPTASPTYGAQPYGPFGAWPFSVPSRPTAYPTPSYMPTINPASFASANAYAGAGTGIPSYGLPAYSMPSIPSYSPIASPYASASAFAGLGSGLGSMYPTLQSYMPQPMTQSPYASANASAGIGGLGGSNQLMQLLLMLLSQLGNGGGNNGGGNYGQQMPPAPPAHRPPVNNVVQHNINGQDLNNQTTLKNNGEINPKVNNIIIDPDNVNISGVNTGVQENNDTNTDTTTTNTNKTTDNNTQYPPTAKDEQGRTGYLCPPGTKGTDGFYAGKEFPPGTYMVPKDKHDHHAHYFMPNAPEGTKNLNGTTTTTNGAVDVLQSPLTLDLNGDGKINTTGDTRSDIDIDADGQKDNISKIKDDGMLFIDPNHTGQITSGAQLLGNHTNGKDYANGFDALKDVAKDALGEEAVADGKLDASELKQLEDKTGLGIEVNGQMKKLSDVGVTELNLNYDNTQQGDAFGNEVRQTGTATKDGKNIQFADLWFKKQ